MVERRHRLPQATFDSVKLVLAIYSILKPNSIFVQIGAFDGETADPTAEYVQAGKMKCLLVEPIEASFQKLKAIYDGMPNVHLIQAAISDSDGEMIMHKVRPGSKSDLSKRDALSSFDRGHLIRHAVRENDIEQIRVRGFTLKSLLAKFDLKKIDILQIDAEGFDAEVVRMALMLDPVPGCINFEHLHLDLETKTMLYDSLTKKGYLYSHGRADTLAVHSRLKEELLALSRGAKSLPMDV